MRMGRRKESNEEQCELDAAVALPLTSERAGLLR